MAKTRPEGQQLANPATITAEPRAVLQTLDPAAIVSSALPAQEQIIPEGSIVDKLAKVYNYLLPLVNFLLYPLGYLRFPREMPVAEQMAQLSEFSKGMTVYHSLLESEKEDIKNLVRGFYISQGINPRLLEDDTPAGQQIDHIVQTITNFYPLLYMINPQIVAHINPRSAFPLAQQLNHVFARNALLPPEQIKLFSEIAARTILNDHTLHQGFNTIEIGEIAEQAARHGLLSFDSPEAFTRSLAGILRITAPLKEQALLLGSKISPKDLADIANKLVALYPSMTTEEVAMEVRRELALARRGGEYRMLSMLPESQEYLRRAGVSIDELEKQHAELKAKAGKSIFGAALGAIARAVQEGVVRPGTPAYALYQKAQHGEPLDVIHPNQLYQIMVRSGINPQVAATMMLTPEESTHYLTPQMINSIRATQYMADWAPRFAMLRRVIPGNDPQSNMMRDALASKLVSQAGYKNIHHFLALHGPVLANVPELRQAALNEAGLSTALAGYEQYPWGGLARAITKIHDIGKGKHEIFTIGDLLGPLAEIYKAPPIDIVSGMNMPTDPLKALGYQKMIQPYVKDILLHDPMRLPGTANL